jgi:hypothetical protein
MSKLFFVLGQAALKELVYLEEIIKAMKVKTDQQQKKKPAAASQKKKGGKSANKEEDDEELEAIEKELGVTSAETAEDETSRRKVCVSAAAA